MHSFLLSLGMIFLAELGDKTQLVALTLATKFSAGVTIAGIFCATLLVHVVSVALGGTAGELLPTALIQFAAGLAFIGFGFWTLRGDSLDNEEEGKAKKAASPFMLVATTFFLAELGDKTMLSTVTLAATNPILPVWLGSTLGMVLSDGLAIIIGTVLGARLPERAVKIGASVIFFGFGIVSMFQGGSSLTYTAWVIGAVIIAAMLGLYIKASRQADRKAEYRLKKAS